MGTVIRFPDERRPVWHANSASAVTGPAAVIILPVVRVERSGDEAGAYPPEARTPGGGSRHRRGR
jgi:hypothetical protein